MDASTYTEKDLHALVLSYPLHQLTPIWPVNWLQSVMETKATFGLSLFNPRTLGAPFRTDILVSLAQTAHALDYTAHDPSVSFMQGTNIDAEEFKLLSEHVKTHRQLYMPILNYIVNYDAKFRKALEEQRYREPILQWGLGGADNFKAADHAFLRTLLLDNLLWSALSKGNVGRDSVKQIPVNAMAPEPDADDTEYERYNQVYLKSRDWIRQAAEDLTNFRGSVGDVAQTLTPPIMRQALSNSSRDNLLVNFIQSGSNAESAIRIQGNIAAAALGLRALMRLVRFPWVVLHLN